MTAEEDEALKQPIKDDARIEAEYLHARDECLAKSAGARDDQKT